MGFPQKLEALQNLTYPGVPGTGAPVIITLYRHSPAWSQSPPGSKPGGLQAYPNFSAFVEEFCRWKPEQGNEAPAATGSASDEQEAQTTTGDF